MRRPEGPVVSDGRAYRRSYAPRAASKGDRAVAVEARRSHAAIPVAVVLLGLGLYLGRYTFLAPALIGIALLGSGLSFLSARVNPLSPHFYLTRKPSWPAVGVVFLGGLLLLAYAYTLVRARFGLALPGL